MDPVLDDWESYSARVHDYEQTWWFDDPAATTHLAADPVLEMRILRQAERNELVQTSDVYKDARSWATVRIARHREMIGDLLGPAAPAEARPTALIITGLPGGGKSTIGRRVGAAWLAAHGRLPANASFDPDAVRVRLPEFRDGLGSTVVQVEAVDVAAFLLQALLGRRRTLFYDAVGDPLSTAGAVNRLAAAGYEVHLILVHADVETAVARVKRRALAPGGRYVPLSYVRSIGNRPRTTFDLLRQQPRIAGWVALDGEAGRDEPPPVIEASPEWGASGKPVAFW